MKRRSIRIQEMVNNNIIWESGSLWYRRCPECGKECGHLKAKYAYLSITHNRLCKSCKQSGDRNPRFGMTGSLSPMWGKKNPDYPRGENHPRFGMTGSLSPCYGLKWTMPEESIQKALETRWKNGKIITNVYKSCRSGWVYIGGQHFYKRSSYEGNYARLLQWKIDNGNIDGVTSWKHEPERFVFDGIKRGTRSYTPDFRVEFIDGHIEYHETKGWLDDKSKLKHKRMAKYFPQIVLVVITSKEMRELHYKYRDIIPEWERTNQLR